MQPTGFGLLESITNFKTTNFILGARREPRQIFGRARASQRPPLP